MTNELLGRMTFLDNAAIQIAASLAGARAAPYAEGYSVDIAEHAYDLASELLEIRDQLLAEAPDDTEEETHS